MCVCRWSWNRWRGWRSSSHQDSRRNDYHDTAYRFSRSPSVRRGRVFGDNISPQNCPNNTIPHPSDDPLGLSAGDSRASRREADEAQIFGRAILPRIMVHAEFETDPTCVGSGARRGGNERIGGRGCEGSSTWGIKNHYNQRWLPDVFANAVEICIIFRKTPPPCLPCRSMVGEVLVIQKFSMRKIDHTQTFMDTGIQEGSVNFRLWHLRRLVLVRWKRRGDRRPRIGRHLLRRELIVRHISAVGISRGVERVCLACCSEIRRDLRRRDSTWAVWRWLACHVLRRGGHRRRAGGRRRGGKIISVDDIRVLRGGRRHSLRLRELGKAARRRPTGEKIDRALRYVGVVPRDNCLASGAGAQGRTTLALPRSSRDIIDGDTIRCYPR